MFLVSLAMFGMIGWASDGAGGSVPRGSGDREATDRARATSLFDFTAQVAARNLPRGAAISGEAGYGTVLWGQRGPGEFRYGYVRPYAKLQTSVLVTRGEAAIELFPISILGLAAGVGGAVRAVDLDTIDCAAAECRGSLGRLFARARVVAGVGPLFAVLRTGVERLNPSRISKPFADDSSTLVGTAGGDTLASTDLLLGWKASESWDAGLRGVVGKMVTSGGGNDEEDLFVRHRRGEWTGIAGLGAYRSSTASRGLTAFFAVQWIPLAGIGLI